MPKITRPVEDTVIRRAILMERLRKIIYCTPLGSRYNISARFHLFEMYEDVTYIPETVERG